MPAEEAKTLTENIYNKLIAFSPSNLFSIPKCNATKELIKEFEFLIKEYTNGTYLQPIALKTLAILPHLICQRTHAKSKASDDIKAMKRRMELWKRGDVLGLLKEAKELQGRRRKSNSKVKKTDKFMKFANQMKQG